MRDEGRGGTRKIQDMIQGLSMLVLFGRILRAAEKAKLSIQKVEENPSSSLPVVLLQEAVARFFHKTELPT